MKSEFDRKYDDTYSYSRGVDDIIEARQSPGVTSVTRFLASLRRARG
jgi:hypothetical protein